MGRVANPQLDRARTRYKICLALTSRLRWFNRWSRLCVRKLNELDPASYPIGRERRPSPGYYKTTIDQAGFR